MRARLFSVFFALSSGAGLPSMASANPAFCVDSAPIPLPPSQWEGGDFRLFYARGFAPCIPDIKPLAARTEPAVQVPAGGGLPSLPPACPAFRFDSAPILPLPPSQWGGGDFRLFYARGFAPCILGAEPKRRREQGRTTHPAGACPNLAGSAGVSGTLQGAAFLAACRSTFPSPPLPLCAVHLAERRLGGQASQGQRPLPRAKKAPPHTRQGF